MNLVRGLRAPTTKSASPSASGIFLLHAAVFVGLAAWSWRKWPDPLIDFGRELYTPWQLAEGRVLYVGIAAVFGPFSQYFNALWFRLLGTSFTTLIVVNLAILAAMLFGIHRWFSRRCDRSTATAVTMVTLCLFAFPQYVGIGNYNFVTPYSHEATHSVALSVAILLASDRAIRRRQPLFFLVAGVLFGCVLLTKIETSLAIGVASAAGMAMAAMLSADDRASVLRGAAWFAAGTLIVPSAFLAYFSFHMETVAALRSIAGPVLELASGGIAGTRFYAAGMGTDAPAANMLRMLLMFAGFAGFVAAASLADLRWPRHLSRRQNVMWRAGRLVVLALALVFVPWHQFPRALPLITFGALCLFAVLLYRTRNDREEALKNLSMMVWAVFALIMLFKMVLNARLYHYGFFLALPSTLLLVALVTSVFPGFLSKGSAGGQVFRTLAGLMLLAGVGNYLGLSLGVYARKEQAIGSGGDRFYTVNGSVLWEGAAVAKALEWIERSVPADATLAVLPDGAMINFQSRRRNPTPFINVTPPVLLAFGEGRILRTFQTTPPDYVLIVHRDQSEYGVAPFGNDPRNGKAIMDWLKGHYRTIRLIGTREVGQNRGGIEILARQSP